MKPAVRVLLACALLCACAPQSSPPQLPPGQVEAEARKQQELAMRDYLAKLVRMDRVAWAIRSKNADLCGEDTVYRPGLKVAETDNYPKEMREAAKTVLGVRSRPTVYFLTKDGPAEAAGVQRGDVLVAVAGQEVESRSQALKALDKALADGTAIRLTVKRAGLSQDISVQPAKVCANDVTLKIDSTVNAFADGKGITVHTALMNFVQSDDELAEVIGHEMAHNTQGHIRAKMGNSLLGTLLVDVPIAILTGVNPNLGSQLGGQVYSQAFETEADYVGLYYTARAGYDIQNVADFWRRMAMENPRGISMGTTHPSSSSRFVALEAARDEIKAKAAQGKELKPEMQGK